MELRRRSTLIYGLLLGVWVLVVAWQIEEHLRVRDAAKADLRNRSKEIANTLSAVMRAMRFRGALLQDRLEPVLNELVNERTNELVRSSELLSIVLLNTAGDPVVSAGQPVNLSPKAILEEGEHWGTNSVTFVNAIAGASVSPGGETNPVVVLPPFHDFTNGMRNGREEFRHRPPPGPGDLNDTNNLEDNTNSMSREEWEHHRDRDGRFPPPGPPPGMNRYSHDGGFGPRRPPWMRWMDEKEYESLVKKRELHGLVMTMSTENFQTICVHDLWLRYIIVFFASISVVGIGLAWRNVSKTSELQIRLVRASELNSHLKEMNLAAAGLAHETRNPLNIIRGLAQMISKQPEAPTEIRDKSRAIVDETDKVTAQLNEFINYSRPREVRRAKLALNAAVNEAVRALGYDIEEKKIQVETKGEELFIEADEQLLRQALFNLLLNATQAVNEKGRIQIITKKASASEASLEICDDGPGVAPERRQEIFKPYFTTQQKGTGLGLAVVQQIVLAHGWEIECLPNEPHGAVFRITHLKLMV